MGPLGGSSSQRQERLKSRFRKMTVRGQGLFQFEFTHYYETGAIGKRIIVVGVPAEEGLCEIEPFLSNPDHGKGVTLFDNLQQFQRGRDSRSGPGQRDRLVQNVVGQD